jgi:folate-binding Fe-S cluster repair protein YgfZ
MVQPLYGGIDALSSRPPSFSIPLRHRYTENSDMSEKVFVRLDQRAVIEVGGEERRGFLQGLVSNDMAKVAPDRAVYTAFLTPQGKFLFDLFVVEKGDVLLLETEAGRIEEFRKKLSMYKLRSKVTIAVADNVAVFAVMGDGAADALGVGAEAGAAEEFAGGVAFVDPRLAGIGLRALLSEDGGGRGPHPPRPARRQP